MTRIAGIEIVQAATFQRVSSGNLLLICGRLWVFVLLLCALAPSTGAQTVAGNSPPADVALTSFPPRTNPLDKITPVTDTLLAYVPDSDQATTFPPLVPEIQNPPEPGAAIWVFELAD